MTELDAALQQARASLAANQLDAAQAQCLRILDRYQHHPETLALLGGILNAQARHNEAVAVFRSLTVMQPQLATHWQNLGAALRPAGRYEEALAAFERALQLAGPNATLLYNLGVLQMQRLDLNAAHLALRDAVRMQPDDATARWAFAQCCYDLIDSEQAIEALQGWENLQNLTLEMTARIARLLVMLGEPKNAAAAIEQLLASKARPDRVSLILAGTLERLQRLDEAECVAATVQRTGMQAESDVESDLLSGVLAERRGDYASAYRFFSQAARANETPMLRHQALFPLARVCDSLGRYGEAYEIAQDAHRSQLAFCEIAMGKSIAKESAILARTAKPCDPSDVLQWQEVADNEQPPIFIVGFPRSGTTLLEQVLDAHPLLCSMDEQPFLIQACNEVIARSVNYPAELGRLSNSDLVDIRERYWERARKRSGMGMEQRLVDKMPVNMTLLPLIRRLFPKARIILAIRHPCDTLLSCFLQSFRAPELALLCRDLPTLGSAYNRMFSVWYSQVALLHPNIHEIFYERLTADFAAQVRILADYLQLPWDDAMLQPGDRARSKGFISTPSYSQVVKPINSRSVGRWRHYRGHFEPLLPLVTPWIERWGYDLN
jgi:tetratricopeptide (TPR) repeat protein